MHYSKRRAVHGPFVALVRQQVFHGIEQAQFRAARYSATDAA